MDGIAISKVNSFIGGCLILWEARVTCFNLPAMSCNLVQYGSSRYFSIHRIWFCSKLSCLMLNFLVLHLYREYRDHVKDLSCISQDLCRVVIVDNNPFSFLLQPLNGIPCVPFSAGQPLDNQVETLLHLWSLEIIQWHLFTFLSCPRMSSSFLKSYFHSLNGSLPRRMSDLFCMKSFTCLSGSKSMASLLLAGRNSG